MKRVLFLISNDNMQGGGAEEIMRLILFRLLSQGDDIHVFFLLEKRYGHWDSYASEKLHLYYSKGGGKRGIFSIINNFWQVRRIRFDYSFSSIVECTGLIGIMKRIGILKINHVIGRESTLIFNRFKGVYLWTNKIMYVLGYPAVELLICQTQLMKEELLEHLPWLTKHMTVVVLPNPVDIPTMNHKALEKTDAQNYKPYIVAAGRVHPVKGFDILIRAFANIKQVVPGIRLVILGGERGQEKKRLQVICSELGLGNDVVFKGQVANVYPYFRDATVCVVSSLIEGFPNVLLQMMSQNDKVVSTTCAGGIDEIRGLYTCPPSNVEALARCILECMKANTSQNRFLFDHELASRSIVNYVDHIIDLTN